MLETRPSIDYLRGVLRDAGLALAGVEDISYLGDGWEQWAFRAGDSVVRLPKEPRDAAVIEKLRREARVSQALASRLPLPISVLELHEVPGGLAFSTHRLVPGVPLWQLRRPAAQGFGAALGGFLKTLHAIPVAEMVALGVEVVDGARLRAFKWEDWQIQVRRVFPLISCEARAYASQVFERMIRDPSLYDYEPRLVHRDIDERNVVADPVSGEITGVIDFGDVVLGNPSHDFVWAHAGGFQALGISEQLPDLLRAGDIDEGLLKNQREYVGVFWRFDEILHGLEIGDDEVVGEAIERLNQVVPFGVKC